MGSRVQFGNDFACRAVFYLLSKRFSPTKSLISRAMYHLETLSRGTKDPKPYQHKVEDSIDMLVQANHSATSSPSTSSLSAVAHATSLRLEHWREVGLSLLRQVVALSPQQRQEWLTLNIASSPTSSNTPSSLSASSSPPATLKQREADRRAVRGTIFIPSELLPRSFVPPASYRDFVALYGELGPAGHVPVGMRARVIEALTPEATALKSTSMATSLHATKYGGRGQSPA